MHEVKTRLTDKDFLAKLNETKKVLEGKIKKNPNKVEFISSFLTTAFIMGFILIIIGIFLKSDLGLIISAIGLFLNFILLLSRITIFKKYPSFLRIIKFRQKYGLPLEIEGDSK